MALDVAAPSAGTTPRAIAFQRLAAVPTWAWIGAIVLSSFGGRSLAALGRVVPYYLPDEYIYPSLARSLAEHGRPLIRGAPAHFPALLDPLATAPVWLVTSDPQTAWRLTQGLHSLFVALAAIPAYLFPLLRASRRIWVSIVLLVAPPAVLFAVFGRGRVLGVYAQGHSALRPGAIAAWIGRDAMLLAYSCGWAIV